MSAGRRQRLGLFGGTFDPIHAGHLGLAEAAADAAGLDEVRFLANRRSPHKAGTTASGPHRHAMVALATQDRATFVADPRELERPEPSWSIDTLDDFAGERPEADLFFLVGADSVRDLPAWHRWKDLLRAARLVVVGRAGRSAEAALAAAPPELAQGGAVAVDREPPPWSATRLREDLAAGHPPPEGALAPAVLAYIRKHSLYSVRDARTGKDPS